MSKLKYQIDLDSLNEFRCPICLNVFQDTVITASCMHRFCNDCITDCLRLGKKECPTCRTKCATKRSLRPDTRFDELISILWRNHRNTQPLVSPNDIQIYQQTMCKMKNAIRSGFVPGSKPQDIIDAESLGSSSQSTATHRKIEIRASSLKENERFKSIKLYVPVLCTVGHIKEAIEQFFHISKVKLSLKNHKSEWLRDEKLLKHLNARDFIYDID